MRDASRSRARARTGLLLLGTWVVLAACSSTPGPLSPSPAADRFAAEEGGRLFQKYCAPCHGPEGQGDGRFFASGLSPTPAALASAEFGRSRSDPDLVRAITHGSAAVGKSDLCPAWGHTFSAPEISYLVTHIRKLQRQAISGGAP